MLIGKRSCCVKVTFHGQYFWRIFGFSEFLGLSPDFCLPIGGIIRNTQVRLLNAWVTALELNRGHISRHLCSAWWSLFVCRFFGFSDLSGLRIYDVSPVRGIIHNTQVILLNAWVVVLELNRSQISRHFLPAWWSEFWSIFRIFGILGFEQGFDPADQENHSQHPGDAFEHLSHSSGANRGQSSRHLCPHGGRIFAPRCCVSTVSTAFARKPWLTVYRAHSGYSPAGGKSGQMVEPKIGARGGGYSRLALAISA